MLAVADLATQIVLVAIGFVLVLQPDILVSQVELGMAPTWSDFVLGIAVGMIAYTGIETISNMAEEAQGRVGGRSREGSGWPCWRCSASTRCCRSIALSAMPVEQNAAGKYTTELGTTYADDPVLGIVENLGLGAG